MNITRLVRGAMYYCSAEKIKAKYIGRENFLMPTGKMTSVAVMEDLDGDVFYCFTGGMIKVGD